MKRDIIQFKSNRTNGYNLRPKSYLKTLTHFKNILNNGLKLELNLIKPSTKYIFEKIKYNFIL